MKDDDVIFCDAFLYWKQRSKGPNEVYNGGDVIFYNRSSGPSIIYSNGTIQFTTHIHHHKLHRTTGPAVINEDGSREFWIENEQLCLTEFFLKYGVM